MIRSTIKKGALLISTSAIVYLLYVLIDTTVAGETYVRIVDNSTDQVAPYPGADINAVEIRNHKTGSQTFASDVTSSSISDGDTANGNQFKVATAATDNPQTEQDPRYVSLGGGEIILRIPEKIRRGDRLVIYEIGADKGQTAEHYTVSTSTSADGPWTDRGQHAGLADITIE